MKEHKTDGTCTTRPIQENTNSNFWWELLIIQKDTELKKKLLQTERTVTVSGMNKQAIRGALQQILVENLDV